MRKTNVSIKDKAIMLPGTRAQPAADTLVLKLPTPDPTVRPCLVLTDQRLAAYNADSVVPHYCNDMKENRARQQVQSMGLEARAHPLETSGSSCT